MDIEMTFIEKSLLIRNSVLVGETGKLIIIIQCDSYNTQFWNWCYEFLSIEKTYTQE